MAENPRINRAATHQREISFVLNFLANGEVKVSGDGESVVKWWLL